jgi:hypothetical protein
MMSQIATVPFFLVAAALLLGYADGLYFLLLGFVFSFVAGL